MVAQQLFALLGMLVMVSGQVLFDGKCNDVTTEQNFNVKDYLGTWFEIKRYEAIFQLGGECSLAQYGVLPNNSVSVNNSYINKFGKHESILGNAYEVNPDLHDGKLKVVFPSVGSPAGDYWVLDTDYKNYSVVWSCFQLNATKNLHKWEFNQRLNTNSV